MHIALLGDSIFDNASYTSSDSDVITQLRQILLRSKKATLLAVDGATCDDVPQQLASLPADVTHLVLSAGGNDALQVVGALVQQVSSVAEAMLVMAEVTDAFEARYARLLSTLVSEHASRRLVVCTIYNPRFPDALEQRACVAALCHFNDAIIRQAASHKLPILDLRAICTEDADYANEIEPSVQGGGKIAFEIAKFLGEHKFSSDATVMYPIQ